MDQNSQGPDFRSQDSLGSASSKRDASITADGRTARHAALTLVFGAGGNGAAHLVNGWSGPERKYRWMTDSESALCIDQRFSNVDHILELDMRPFLALPRIPKQRLTVFVNDCEVAHTTVEREGRYGYRIPAGALVGRASQSIVLRHPDALRPCDVRDSKDRRMLSLAVAQLRMSPARPGVAGCSRPGTGGIPPTEVQNRVGLDPARLILNFESLANNCEFGRVQRNCGADPFFSLLRFAGMELPTLLRALELGFADFADPPNVEIRLDDKPRPEFVVHENRYGVFFHTFRYQDEAQASSLLASETKRLAYCARRLLADFKQGGKILVFKRNDRLREEEVLPLFVALANFGENDLLWVVPADAVHASGSVEAVLPGLYKGYIERFAPMEDAPDLLLHDWLEICANAYLLRREERQSAGSR